MSELKTIESTLHASRLDVDDHVALSVSCERHALCESKMRAMIDVLRPLSRSIEVYVTR